MKTIIAKEWRSGIQTIGFVAVRDDTTGKWRAYVGVAQNFDEETDAQYISDWGGKLSKTEAMAFFPRLDPDKYNE